MCASGHKLFFFFCHAILRQPPSVFFPTAKMRGTFSILYLCIKWQKLPTTNNAINELIINWHVFFLTLLPSFARLTVAFVRLAGGVYIVNPHPRRRTVNCMMHQHGWSWYQRLRTSRQGARAIQPLGSFRHIQCDGSYQHSLYSRGLSFRAFSRRASLT